MVYIIFVIAQLIFNPPYFNLIDSFDILQIAKMLSKLSAIIVTSIGLVAQVNAQKLDLTGVKLKNISYGGSGCPQGSFVKVQESDVNG